MHFLKKIKWNRSPKITFHLETFLKNTKVVFISTKDLFLKKFQPKNTTFLFSTKDFLFNLSSKIKTKLDHSNI
ncbi:hypothetical protein LEP1GSC074_2582 [Leptospira noguchii str. Hook]|uniref:Uncharacterized protein n=1 Tax=Leptospira noguchii serovar Autumnalis str. ZUN142 TaxID=1085540 RepID=M6UCW7_9LEPT|nr:hypothetical protein LEP1GSC186_4370 [Leptospira noguchii serovar Autumnalis str. ZUN142]EMS83273.1 hypothetical protein LEP1GSC074_2582 [Leptospira noguchii str. Hook]